MGAGLLNQVVAAIDTAATTLLFTNTRSQAELWYCSLVEKRLDWLTTVSLHHGSIDRKLRARIEQSSEAGRAALCGLHILARSRGRFSPGRTGHPDRSPKGVGRLIQRAGRSGHRPGAASRILCVPTHAWELVEIAAARVASEARRMEARRPLKLALDVLIQHRVTLAAGPGFDATELLAEVRSTYSYAEYRRVSRADDGLLRTADQGIARRFAGRVLRLVQVKDMTAYVRTSTARRTRVPRWQGGRLPLSVELADSVLEMLGDPNKWQEHPQMQAVAPLLEVQSRWSALPSKDALLVEQVRSREGSHLFVYPFCGRLANEGIATLVAARGARESPQTFAVGANDYGFELLSATPIDVSESRLQAAAPRFTPLAFPLWASRLQTQMVSTESWQQRIERAAQQLEAQAARAA